VSHLAHLNPSLSSPMVCIAARPTHGIDVFAGDPGELTEVRWVSAEEADEIMGGAIFEPVRQHIRQTLRADDGV
jgi:NADH pyrophosphatase NudC (nudix superfamily)